LVLGGGSKVWRLHHLGSGADKHTLKSLGTLPKHLRDTLLFAVESV
jgi:hypothetical protein